MIKNKIVLCFTAGGFDVEISCPTECTLDAMDSIAKQLQNYISTRISQIQEPKVEEKKDEIEEKEIKYEDVRCC